MPNDNKSNKKRILIISSLVITIIIGGVVFTVFSFDKTHLKNNQQTSKTSDAAKKDNAEAKKKEGIKASMSGDAKKAKQLLLEAKSEYKALNDTDNVVDTNAQLYFIEHPSAPPTTPPASN